MEEKGNGRLQLGVGVPNRCPKAASDLNQVLALEGSVCQKGDMVAAFQSADRAATYKYLLDSPPDLRRYASMWFFFYGVASVILLATSAVAAGFVVLWSFVDVAQGCTPGSIFFAIAIQQAAAFVNRQIAGQTMRFIVDDCTSAGPPGLVKRCSRRRLHQVLVIRAGGGAWPDEPYGQAEAGTWQGHCRGPGECRI